MGEPHFFLYDACGTCPRHWNIISHGTSSTSPSRANSLIDSAGYSSNSYITMLVPANNMDVLAILDEAHANEGATVAPSRKITVKKTQKRPIVEGNTQYTKDSDRPQLALCRLRKGSVHSRVNTSLFAVGKFYIDLLNTRRFRCHNATQIDVFSVVNDIVSIVETKVTSTTSETKSRWPRKLEVRQMVDTKLHVVAPSKWKPYQNRGVAMEPPS
ncbi:hypothetical protein J1N35_005758 [Gossypium stocksii]|uniref:Uncharacterized protein n=1 Tax=Gossypium stocksii TaxID=47602 RepID=A0A9D4AJA2_9ROSI|nr:hypothetical protein J1N35_005758 [Gossypium stocksii]